VKDQGIVVPEPAESRHPAMSGRPVRVRLSDLAWRQTGDEVVVLDLAASVFHGLNPSGALLWQRLADWTTAGEMADILVGSYGLSAALAAEDVARFLEECIGSGLVDIRAEA
jgi:Coenzyme PQQ synthesis protein D (PqqD)